MYLNGAKMIGTMIMGKHRKMAAPGWIHPALAAGSCAVVAGAVIFGIAAPPIAIAARQMSEIMPLVFVLWPHFRRGIDDLCRAQTQSRQVAKTHGKQ